MKRIDKDSRVALYYQLIDIIVESIETGQLKASDKIPSERELCDEYDISRATVRQAIQILEQDGVVYKEHGKGTFVSPEKFKQDLLKFYSFTEEMKKVGKIASTTVLRLEILEADEMLSRKLKLKDHEKIYKITRLRSADDIPMLLVTTFIPMSRFPGFDKEDLENNSMYELFTRKYNAVFSKAEESFQPVYTRAYEADLFGIEVGSPSMKIERTTYENNIIIEYAIGIARGDKFKYGVVLEK